MNVKVVTDQLIVLGKLVTHSGPVLPQDFHLPDDMEIVPWTSFPRMLHLTINGTMVAGTARRDLLESYTYALLTDPEKSLILRAIRDEVGSGKTGP